MYQRLFINLRLLVIISNLMAASNIAKSNTLFLHCFFVQFGFFVGCLHYKILIFIILLCWEPSTKTQVSQHTQIVPNYLKMHNINPLSKNPTKWSSILKQFVSFWQTNCLDLFDYFFWGGGGVGLERKGLNSPKQLHFLVKFMLNICYLERN